MVFLYFDMNEHSLTIIKFSFAWKETQSWRKKFRKIFTQIPIKWCAFNTIKRSRMTYSWAIKSTFSLPHNLSFLKPVQQQTLLFVIDEQLNFRKRFSIYKKRCIWTKIYRYIGCIFIYMLYILCFIYWKACQRIKNKLA